MLFDSPRQALLTRKVLGIGATKFKREIEAVAKGWSEATLLYQVLVKVLEDNHLDLVKLTAQHGMHGRHSGSNYIRSPM